MKNRMIILSGLGLAVLYWVLESVVDVFVFHEGMFFYQVFSPGLREFWMRFVGIVIILVCSVIIQVIVIRRERAEKDLKESEEKFRSLADSLPSVSIQGYDTDGTVFYWNRASECVYGYSVEEAVGKNLVDLIIPSELISKFEDCLKLGARATGSGELVPSSELMLRHKDGHLVSVYSIHSVICVEGRKPLLFCIDFDLSERKKVEEALKESEEEMRKVHDELVRVNQLKTEFTSMVSHELRTPLTAISEGIDIVLEGIEGSVNDDQRATLGISKRNVDRLARLINDILDVSRLEAGKMEMSFDKTDMNELVTEVGNFMSPVAEGKGIELSMEIPDESVFAICDSDRIKQVAINLVDNAIKFTEKGGSVCVSLSNPERDIRIDVEDTGFGIKDEDMSRIFEMFEQASYRNVRKVGGSGLGLSICCQIMKIHNGKIVANSVYGKGSMFTIIFPADLPVSS